MSRWVLASVATASVVVFGPVASGLRLAPDFAVPFPCGQTWIGETRTNHNPPQAVDFNRVDDAGDAVVASASGTVTVVDDLGADGYGRFVVIDHGDGWQTTYAHLSALDVVEAQPVASGTVVGTVGDTGASAGAHLHYEQRLHGRPMRVVFDARETPSAGVRAYVTDRC